MKRPLNQELKIAFLIQSLDWIPNYEEGASIQIFKILRGLQASGHRLTLLASRRNKQVLYAPDVQGEQTAHLSFTGGRAFGLLERGTRSLQTKLNLPWVQFFDSLRLSDACVQHVKTFDLLYERNSMHGIGVALASKQLKLPYVLHVDADFLFEHDFLGIPHTRLERFIAVQTALYNYRAAHAITCVSEVTKEHLVASYGIAANKIFVIPNGATMRPLPRTDDVEAKRAELGLNDAPTAMFLGSFYAWHGLDILVNAFKLVLQQMPKARLVLVGDGKIRPDIEAQAGRLGISERVIFTGSVPHEQVPLLLGVADITVAPYPRLDRPLWFSPMKVFEYMAASRAVVASRAGQITHVVEHGRTGVLVEPGDVEALAGAMLDLLANAERRRALGEAARRTVEREYTWVRYIEKLEAVFDYAMDAMAAIDATASTSAERV